MVMEKNLMKVNSVHSEFIVVFVFILSTLLLSCTGNKTYDRLLTRVDSIMNIADDSAKVSIRMLDGVKPELPKFTKAQKMRYYLLYHKAMNKAYIDFTSDSTMLAVVDYYEHHGSANDKMLAYYILGCVYRDMHEAPMALEYYNKATEQADTTSTNCDYATLCRIFSQMGVLFAKQYLPYQELTALKKAVKYAYLAKDTLNAIRYYQNQSNAYANLNMDREAISINIEAANMFRKYGYIREADIAYYLKLNEIEKAKQAFVIYNKTNFKGNLNFKDSFAFLLYEKGLYFMRTNQLDSAYSILNKSLIFAQSLSNKAIVYKTLAQYYLRVNNSVLAAKYALMSTEYKDSDLVEVRNGQLHEMQSMYDYNRNKDLAIVAKQKAEERQFVIYFLLLSAVALFGLAFYIYSLLLSKKSKKITLVQQLYNDSLSKLHTAQKELQLIKKQNDLVTVQEKEKTILKIKNTLKDIQEKFSGSLLSDVDIILQNSAIYRKIQFILIHPKEKLTNEDWIELSDFVEQLIPCFSQILKNYLTEKEYHICLLIRFRISPSSISNLVDLSNSGVSLSRKRMYEKICGKVGTAKDFDNYVLSLS